MTYSTVEGSFTNLKDIEDVVAKLKIEGFEPSTITSLVDTNSPMVPNEEMKKETTVNKTTTVGRSTGVGAAVGVVLGEAIGLAPLNFFNGSAILIGIVGGVIGATFGFIIGKIIDSSRLQNEGSYHIDSLHSGVLKVRVDCSSSVFVETARSIFISSGGNEVMVKQN
jgi:hypothetical protein